MWCDSFDADLLKLIPIATDILGDVANVHLWTYCDRPDGCKLNGPCAWNHSYGMVSFFGLESHGFKPTAYFTDAPLVRCTFMEACRDLWCHHALMMVNANPCIDFYGMHDAMLRLMSHGRGIKALTDAEYRLTVLRVEAELAIGVRRFQRVLKEASIRI